MAREKQEKRPFRYVSVFSGIEAATVAARPLGWEALAFAEVDPFPCAVLAERFPEVPNLGDVTKIDWRSKRREWGPISAVFGGSPCQSFSVAGKREGLAGESGLMLEYIRCVRELVPRWFVWENVPGALSSEDGAAFGTLLREMDALGYGLCWRVLDSQFFGVAQRRERVFLVGRLGGLPPVSVLFEPDGLSRDTPPSREKRQALAAAAGRGAACAGFKFHQGAKSGGLGERDEESPTLTADWHNPGVYSLGDDNGKAAVGVELCGTLKCGGSAPTVAGGPSDELPGSDAGGKPGGGKGPLVQEEVSGALATTNEQTLFHGPLVRRLTPTECERLQGFEDGWTRVPYRGKPAEECPDGPRYKALGNSMTVNVMRWIFGRIDKVERGELPE